MYVRRLVSAARYALSNGRGLAHWALRWRDRLVALSVLDQDALLYCSRRILAFGTILLGESADYRQWAEMALGPYALGAVICCGGSVAPLPSGQEERDAAETARWPAQGHHPRSSVTVVLVPLSVEVVCGPRTSPGDEVQNEVTVIEACGDRVMPATRTATSRTRRRSAAR